MQPNVITVPSRGSRRPHPLLFVHGAWHGAWCWESFLGWFAERGWDSHALDLRGHGDSDSDRSLRTTRLKHYVEDLAAVVDTLEEPPIIVAHSMGSLITQRYLEDTVLPGAVLLAPVPLGGVWRATLRTARRHPVKFLKANLTWSLEPLVENRSIAAGLFLPAETPDDQIDWVWEHLQGESFPAYLDMLFFVRARPQLVHTPVRIVAGSADRLFAVGEMGKIAAAYGTDPLVIEGAAHDLMLGPTWEQAAEAVAASLAGF